MEGAKGEEDPIRVGGMGLAGADSVVENRVEGVEVDGLQVDDLD